MYTSYTRFQMAFISIVAALLVGCAARQTISEAPEQRSAYADELIPTPAPPLPEAAATTASQQTARSSERLGTQWGEGVSSNVVTVNYPPKVAISALVNSLKGVSSRMLRKKNYPSIRKKLWGNALWSPSYFAGSCGGAPISIIRQYIEQQKTPH